MYLVSLKTIITITIYLGVVTMKMSDIYSYCRTKCLFVFIALACIGLFACGKKETTNNTGGDFDQQCRGCRKAGETCVKNVNCPAGSICNLAGDLQFRGDKQAGVCIKLACESKADCDEGEECSPSTKECERPVCTDNTQCGNQKCIAGACKDPISPSLVSSCSISTGDKTITSDTMIPLRAFAKDANNNVLPFIEIEWTSSDSEVVAIVKEGDITSLKGGSKAGEAEISAKVKDGVECGKISINNVAKESEKDLTVIVRDYTSGAPIKDAQVVVMATGNNTPIEVQTNADGVAEFDSIGSDIDSVTVFGTKPSGDDQGHDYVTFIKPDSKTLFVPLQPVRNKESFGGYKGKFDFSKVKNNAIKLGFAGTSISTSLVDFRFDFLFGDTSTTTITIPGTTEAIDAPLPGAVTLSLRDNNYKPDYISRGWEGNRIAWGFGGSLEIADITDIISELSDTFANQSAEDEVDVTDLSALPIGEFLTTLLPVVGKFQHGIVHDVNLTYKQSISHFPSVDIALDQKHSQHSVVTVPKLPKHPRDSSKYMGGGILLAAVNVEGRGMVPVGLTAALDDPEETGTRDGIVNPNYDEIKEDGKAQLNLVPRYNGLEEDPFVLGFFTIPIELDEKNQPIMFAVVINNTSNIGTAYEMTGSFVGFMKGTFKNRSFTISGKAEDADIHRLLLTKKNKQTKDERHWAVFADGSSTSLSIPTPPDGFEDVAASPSDVWSTSIKVDGDYQELIRLGGKANIDTLQNVLESFTLLQCQKKKTDNNPICFIE